MDLSAGKALAIAVIGLSLVGCRGAPVRPDVYASDPESRIAGLIAAAESDDPDMLAVLLEAMADDDTAVRMFAAESLRRRTAKDFGYRAYDPPARRDQAIARWRQYLNGQLAGAAAPDNQD